MRAGSTHRPSRLSWRALLLLLALATLPYLNALTNDFVYDDHALVTDNGLVRSLDPRLMAAPSLDRHRLEWYRPLTIYSLALNYRASGLNPLSYHVVNVLLHAGNTLLLYGVALRLLTSAGPALVAAGLFAVHAVHVEAVTPVSGRADLLATLFTLIAWRLTLTAGRRMTWGRASLLGASTLAGLLAKESAIVIWPLIALSHLMGIGGAEGEERGRAKLASHGAVHVAVGLAVAGYFALRLVATGALIVASGVAIRTIENPLIALDAGPRLATAAWVLVKYCGLLVAPIGLSADYSFNQIPAVETWGDPRLLTAGLLLPGLAAAVVASYRRDRAIAFSLLLLILLWLPISNTLIVIGTIMAERLLYLVSVAFALLVGACAARLSPGSGAMRAALVLAAALVAVGHGGLATVRNTHWRTQEALFRDTVERSPDSAKARFNYGIVLQAKGRHTEAGEQFATALRIAPTYAEAHNALGTVLLERGDLPGAETRFRAAIAADARLATPWINLGTALFRSGRDDEAVRALQQALRLRPESVTAHATLGAIAERRGARDAAIEHYLAAFRLSPDFEGLGPHLARLLTSAGRDEEARRVLQDLQRTSADR